MDIRKYNQLRARVLRLMQERRQLWYRMDRAEVASYRWSVLFTQGKIAQPNTETLEAVEAWLTSKASEQKKQRRG